MSASGYSPTADSIGWGLCFMQRNCLVASITYTVGSWQYAVPPRGLPGTQTPQGFDKDAVQAKISVGGVLLTDAVFAGYVTCSGSDEYGNPTKIDFRGWRKPVEVLAGGHEALVSLELYRRVVRSLLKDRPSARIATIATHRSATRRASTCSPACSTTRPSIVGKHKDARAMFVRLSQVVPAGTTGVPHGCGIIGYGLWRLEVMAVSIGSSTEVVPSKSSPVSPSAPSFYGVGWRRFPPAAVEAIAATRRGCRSAVSARCRRCRRAGTIPTEYRPRR